MVAGQNQANEQKDRNTQMRDEYNNGGVTLQDLADRYGISRQRAHQIIKGYSEQEAARRKARGH